MFARCGIERHVAAIGIALYLIAGASGVSADASKNPFAGNAEAAVEGKALYLKNGCYACHGHEAEGAVGPDLTDDEWVFAFSEQMVFNTISRGRKGTVMSPFKDQLQPDEIWKVIEFLVDANRKRKAKQ